MVHDASRKEWDEAPPRNTLGTNARLTAPPMKTYLASHSLPRL